ncbi:hypothetical protein CDD81_6373 [Ophiocordyceps australis]|uniref:Amidohydrolase-related domain-containing protein n=1 Tax=Ophiocordyceps australis TaxID=1399860 RepID=A0A2C5Y714_9HYPO|nr:hypothetical protein CDD81_6373 [Ophiocordyceps australis]
MALSKPTVVDIHTHMYTPSYIKLLQGRSAIPLVRQFAQAPEPRLVLFESESRALAEALRDPSSAAKTVGRALTPDYTSLQHKMSFMDAHGIDISVVSPANPWLDFIAADEAGQVAQDVNTEMADMCEQQPGRLYFFGVLPLRATLETVMSSVQHLQGLQPCRGVIMGTNGMGNGMDDKKLLPVFEALAASQLTLFLHPHQGLPQALGSSSGGADYGHVLPLALGFPFETTIGVTRMYLSGVFDAVRNLRLILAHSGGTLPFLAGRIESCIQHDAELARAAKGGKERRSVWNVLREQIYLDALVYSDVGVAAAIGASGADRLMFGSDHPFFPPLAGMDTDGMWPSVSINATAVTKAVGEGTPEAKAIMGANAIKILGLEQK